MSEKQSVIVPQLIEIDYALNTLRALGKYHPPCIVEFKFSKNGDFTITADGTPPKEIPGFHLTSFLVKAWSATDFSRIAIVKVMYDTTPCVAVKLHKLPWVDFKGQRLCLLCGAALGGGEHLSPLDI